MALNFRIPERPLLGAHENRDADSVVIRDLQDAAALKLKTANQLRERAQQIGEQLAVLLAEIAALQRAATFLLENPTSARDVRQDPAVPTEQEGDC